MADQVVVTDKDAVETITKYATQLEVPASQAAAKLVGIAKSRINALRKYAKKVADGDAGKKEAKPKKAAKVAKAKK